MLMDIQKKQLALYKKIVSGGLYNFKGVNEVVSLIKTDGYLEFLHEKLVEQIKSAEYRLERTKFDKISVVMDSSKASRKKLMSIFIDEFSNSNVVISVKDYSKVPAEKIPYKFRLKIQWIKEDVMISVYFENKYNNNTKNIKIDFNLTKSRDQALDVFSFIYRNLPKTKALKIFRDARINRLERYLLLKDIPVWGVLAARAAIVKGTDSYDARGANNKIAASYYISKDNSKEVAVYDKYASDSRLDDDDPDKYEFGKDGSIQEAFIESIGDIATIETKVEIRNYKNRMNKKQRGKSLFFSNSSTFPTYFRTLHFYSPLVLRKLSEEQLRDLISNGFYNFLISESGSGTKKVLDKYVDYKIEFHKKERKAIEENFNVVYSSFILDLSKDVGQELFDPSRPLNKKYGAKTKKRKQQA